MCTCSARTGQLSHLVKIANEILMYIRAGKKHVNDVFLQNTLGTDRDGNEISLADKLADDADSVDNQVGLKMQIKHMYEVLKRVLTGRDKTVIELRYGLDGQDTLTQREVSERLNISRSYVSRIEKRALESLREELEDSPMQEMAMPC